MSGENEQATQAITENTTFEDTTKDKFLTFAIDAEEYGVEIIHIKEIISVCAITQVPETIDYVKGIINLRGDIIPVIDVRTRFYKEPREFDAMTCIVVIEYGDYVLGLIVDNVREVLHIDEEHIQPPPNAKLIYHNQFIKNIGRTGDRVVLLLDLERLLNQEQ